MALLLAMVQGCLVLSASATCTAPKNPIEAENCLAGNPSSDWYVSGAGSPNIQGFTTDISVNLGQTVFFKVSTSASAYRIDIYRLGYYQGNGARKVASISPSVQLPQAQPTCLTDSSTGLTDCGNWAVSASWAVPSTATSGIYFAKLVRPDTGDVSPVIFVVRNDSSHSDILVQTDDPTWHAYNDYGGSSLYTGPTIRAFKVSYNRPFNVPNPATWPLAAEYPMVRWLEANGYDVTYFAGVDTDRNGQLITQHKIFMSVGHDEYWSGGQRASVEAARSAGVNLAFFSGNEIWWKTRWESSIDGTNTPFRTLVCYKETLVNGMLDPQDPPTWTGIWRDPSFSPPADGGRPENALSGTNFAVDSYRNDPVNVPQADGRMRFWRNTSIATLGPGQTATLPTGVLGYEWDIDADNGFRPAGLIPLSTTTLAVSTLLLHDNTFGNGTATHHLTLYRAPSGALVFGAGTVQWSWGLDANHDSPGTPTDPNMQQATVNLLADMGVQPATLQGGLIPAIISTDATPPRSTITSPSPGAAVTAGAPVTISGTAVDSGGGVVGAVEVSLDGGRTWHPAVGRENWSYAATFNNSGHMNVLSRAVDDSGNLEVPGPGITVTVGQAVCPCTIWPGTASPVVPDAGSYSPLELGVQFRSESNGYITGIRFYKSAANTGTTVGNLWSSSGTLLASATFPVTGETNSGWQQVNFSSPVPITANTMYVASYHTIVGHFALDHNYFVSSGVDNSPLHAPGGAGGANGVYTFAATSTFPTQTYNSENYWVDVVFNYGGGNNPPLSVTTTSLPNGTQSVAYNQSLAATGGTAPYSWSLVSGTLPPGLALSSSGQISGTPTTAGTSNFTVQVTDSSSPAQTATQALSIAVSGSGGSQNNAELSGNYAFAFTGMSGSGGNSSGFAAVGRFTTDGAGNLTAGELDTDGVGPGTAVIAQAFTGTYTIGADGRGVMAWNLSGGTAQLAFAMMANGNARFIKFDASGGSGTIGSGTIEKADTAAYNATKITGDYAFGLAGLDGSNNRAALAGRFTSSGTGTLAGAAGDVNAYGSVSSMTFSSATYAVTDTGTGRGTMSFSFQFAGGADTLNFVFYIVDSGKIFVMENDPVTTATPLLSGTVLQQQTPAGGFSSASLNGNMVIYLTGLSSCANITGPVSKAVAGLLIADGIGTLTLTYDENFCRAPNSVTGAPGTYTASSNGRISMNLGSDGVVAYLVDQNHAFLFSTDTSVLSGFGEPQATGPLTNSAVKGTYTGLADSPDTFSVSVFSGEFTADGASPTGNISGTEDIGSSSGPTSGAAFNATYSISSSPTNGRGTVTLTSGSGGNAIAYVISPSKFVMVPMSDPNPAVWIFEQASVAPSAPPSITTQPTNQTVTAGQTATFAVAAVGTAPMNYQWQKGGAAISGANSSTYKTPPTTTSDSGTQFTVLVRNAAGSVTSSVATLTVNPAVVPPSITTQPTNRTVTAGQTAAFTVAATGTAPLKYQWRRSGTAIAGATNSTYTTPPTTAADNGAQFTVVVSNSAGSATSNPATLTVTQPLPTLTSLTLNPTGVVGGLGSSTGTVTLSAPAPAGGAQVLLSSSNTGAATVPSTVIVPAGATSATFTVRTSGVLIATSSTISASYNGTTKTANLAVLL
jgi:hypothetical protein